MQTVDDREPRPRPRLRTALSYNLCRNCDKTRDGCVKCTIKGTWAKKLCFKPRDKPGVSL